MQVGCSAAMSNHAAVMVQENVNRIQSPCMSQRVTQPFDYDVSLATLLASRVQHDIRALPQQYVPDRCAALSLSLA